MSNEPKHGRGSHEPVKLGRKRSQGQDKLKSLASSANGYDHQFDASSKDNSLSKSKPASLPTGLQKKSKETNGSDETFVIKADTSSNTVSIEINNKNSRLFGTNDEDSASGLLQQVVAVVPTGGTHHLHRLKLALSTVHGIGPKDELEGLLAAQMIGVHNVAMECLKRAAAEGQTFEGMDAHVNRAVRLLRTFTSQMEALNRHRGNVNQQLVVGNVNVSDGGQAIVGPVSHAGRGKALTEDDAEKIE